VPEQRPQAIIDWAQMPDSVSGAMVSETTLL
jgi:hypothetical protein